MGRKKINQQKRHRPKLKIKKDDNVMVISGNDKGKTGRVLMVDYKTIRVLVEGVNIVSKHMKPNAENPDGGIVKKEATIDISNVMLIDPKSGEPTKVGRKIVDNKIVRYAKNSGEVID